MFSFNLENYFKLLPRPSFSDLYIFQIEDGVNKQNVSIFGTERPM